jgi:hypothetical protein
MKAAKYSKVSAEGKMNKVKAILKSVSRVVDVRNAILNLQQFIPNFHPIKNIEKVRIPRFARQSRQTLSAGRVQVRDVNVHFLQDSREGKSG